MASLTSGRLTVTSAICEPVSLARRWWIGGYNAAWVATMRARGRAASTTPQIPQATLGSRL